MRHLGSLALSLISALLIYVLVALGITKTATGFGAQAAGHSDWTAVGIGVAAMLGAAALYAILVMTRLSPLGPVLAGLILLAVQGYGLFTADKPISLFENKYFGETALLSAPIATGLAFLLSIPLFATILSPRRWRKNAQPALASPAGGTYGGTPYGGAQYQSAAPAYPTTPAVDPYGQPEAYGQHAYQAPADQASGGYAAATQVAPAYPGAPAATDPAQPGAPAYPGAPAAYPVAPTQPAYPGAPAEGGQPGAPAQPAYPGAPAEGGYPGATAQPAYPGAPAQLAYPSAPTEGGYPGAPAAYPAAPTQPVYPGAPAEAGQPGAPAQPAYPGVPAQAAYPVAPVQATYTAPPAEATYTVPSAPPAPAEPAYQPPVAPAAPATTAFPAPGLSATPTFPTSPPPAAEAFGPSSVPPAAMPGASPVYSGTPYTAQAHQETRLVDDAVPPAPASMPVASPYAAAPAGGDEATIISSPHEDTPAVDDDPATVIVKPRGRASTSKTDATSGAMPAATSGSFGVTDGPTVISEPGERADMSSTSSGESSSGDGSVADNPSTDGSITSSSTPGDDAATEAHMPVHSLDEMERGPASASGDGNSVEDSNDLTVADRPLPWPHQSQAQE